MTVNKSKRVLFTILAWIGLNAAAWHFIQQQELASVAAQAGVPITAMNAYEARVAKGPRISSHQCGDVHYRLMRPLNLRQSQNAPLLLFLHGSGERGTDNLRQLKGVPSVLSSRPLRAQLNSFVLVPQCPPEGSWASTSTLESGCDALSLAMSAVDDVLRTERVDVTRLYLVGYSMGGSGAWALAARYPERFAAVVPIAGRGEPTWAPRLLGVPVRAVHGKSDTIVPADASREMINAIALAGGRGVYDELDGVAHDSWTPGFVDNQDVLNWLFSHRLTPSTP